MRECQPVLNSRQFRSLNFCGESILRIVLKVSVHVVELISCLRRVGLVVDLLILLTGAQAMAQLSPGTLSSALPWRI